MKLVFCKRYEGPNAVPLGFHNSDLDRAVADQPIDGLGETFEAFVVPELSKTFYRRDKQ